MTASLQLSRMAAHTTLPAPLKRALRLMINERTEPDGWGSSYYDPLRTMLLDMQTGRQPEPLTPAAVANWSAQKESVPAVRLSPSPKVPGVDIPAKVIAGTNALANDRLAPPTQSEATADTSLPWAIGDYDLSWQDYAACDPDAADVYLFSGTSDYRQLGIKKFCTDCIVQNLCMAMSVTGGDHYGVWGGLNERERRKHIGKSSDLLKTWADRLLSDYSRDPTETDPGTSN
jgi:hypothetical protein